MKLECPIGCGSCGALLSVRLMHATTEGGVGGSSDVLEPGIVPLLVEALRDIRDGNHWNAPDKAREALRKTEEVSNG